MFRASGYFFLGLLGLALLAFWRPYVAPFPGDFDPYTHIHVALMLAWFALLVTQPLLIRGERRRLHRRLGATSYVLVPAIAVVTVLLTQVRTAAIPPDELAPNARFVYLPLGMVVLFVVAYTLAIVHRKTVALHARYMMCTALGVVDPIVSRVMYFYGPALPDDHYGQLVSYLVSAGALGVMIFRERDQRAGRTAFPVMLAVTTIVYGLYFSLAHTALWVRFVTWFAAP